MGEGFHDAGPTEDELAQDRLHESRAMAVIEEALGDRFAGSWLDVPTRRVGVAIVDPTEADVRWLKRLVQQIGWDPQVEAVRYSSEQLDAFRERIEPFMSQRVSERWIALWVDPRGNQIAVQLNGADPGFVSRLRSEVPPETLAFVIAPGARYSTL